MRSISEEILSFGRDRLRKTQSIKWSGINGRRKSLVTRGYQLTQSRVKYIIIFRTEMLIKKSKTETTDFGKMGLISHYPVINDLKRIRYMVGLWETSM